MLLSRNPLIMNVLKLFKAGQEYMKVCPDDKTLAFSFPEIKLIRYLKLAIRYMPPIIVIIFVVHYFTNSDLTVTIITALFAFSLPIQGFLWLGKRAISPLPLNLLGIYNKTRQRLINEQIIAAKSLNSHTINFMDFMQLIHIAKSHFGNDYHLDEEN